MDATDGPGRLLEISGSYWQACALQAGAMRDVFTPLCRAPLDAA